MPKNNTEEQLRQLKKCIDDAYYAEIDRAEDSRINALLKGAKSIIEKLDQSQFMKEKVEFVLEEYLKTAKRNLIRQIKESEHFTDDEKKIHRQIQKLKDTIENDSFAISDKRSKIIHAIDEINKIIGQERSIETEMENLNNKFRKLAFKIVNLKF